jgi:hypothetical protein
MFDLYSSKLSYIIFCFFAVCVVVPIVVVDCFDGVDVDAEEEEAVCDDEDAATDEAD